ncbi:MAG TPA: hypothetical protein VIF62_01705, partial [Labilithrix sp.]
MKLPLHGLALLSTIGVAAVSACSSSNAGGPQVSPKQAQDDFVATFTRGAYDQVDAQLAALDAAYQQNPNDPRTTVLLGLANLWGVAEGARVNLSGARQGQLALDGLHYLDLAAQLNPDDARIPGWIGTVSVRIATATNDARLLQDGIASVDQGMSRFPAFNGFPEMIVHSLSDATSPDYDKGLESGWAVMGACAGTTIDRTNPDFSPYMSRWTSTGDLRVCFNPPTAVHNFEGFNLQMGDMQVK